MSLHNFYTCGSILNHIRSNKYFRGIVSMLLENHSHIQERLKLTDIPDQCFVAYRQFIKDWSLDFIAEYHNVTPILVHKIWLPKVTNKYVIPALKELFGKTNPLIWIDQVILTSFDDAFQNKLKSLLEVS